MDYLMLILSAILLAFNFTINKLYQRRNGTGLAIGLAFNAILGLFTAIIFFAVSGFEIAFSTYSLIMATIYSTLIVSYTIVGFRIMKGGSMAIYMLFLMTGGMLVPYIWGIAFLNEGFVPLRLVGLVIMISAVVLSNFGKNKISLVQILMCLSVFILNGFTSVTSKVHQVETFYPIVDSIDFVVLSGIGKFVVSGLAFIVVKLFVKGEKQKITLKGTELLLIASSAVLTGVAVMLQLIGAINLPASVLYPIVTGGTMLLSSLAGVVFFKDKLTRNNVIGLILCFIGTLFFL